MDKACPQIVAMVHVHTNTALQNTAYNDLLKIATYRQEDLVVMQALRQELQVKLQLLHDETALVVLLQCRTAPLLLDSEFADGVHKKLLQMPFVRELVERALSEVEIFVRNGITHVSIENVGAPYFIGDEVPVEEMMIMHLVVTKIRQKYPDLVMGVHVLSSNEIEALPIAISCQASFVRSESTMFSGFRPEGKTINRGNLAKFFYLRNYLNTRIGVSDANRRRLPALWSDIQKKHTVFEQELNDLDIWFDNILFQKIEGVIMTGAETGSDIAPGQLAAARQAIDKASAKLNDYFGQSPVIPLITGSGLDIDEYKKYADYLIVGSKLKEGGYWESAVNEQAVQKLVASIRG